MKARALIIGINNYPAVSSQKTLKGAVEDAIDFAGWALDPAGGGVDPQDCYFWVFPQPDAMPAGLEYLIEPKRPWPVGELAIGPNFNRAPEAHEIVFSAVNAAEMASAGERAEAVDEEGHREGEERLYVFLAGHGAMTPRQGYERDAQNCMIAANYIPNSSQGLIPLDDLRRLLEMRGPEETLLIFDCCRNDLALVIQHPGLNAPQYGDLANNRHWVVARAAQAGALAFETAADNQGKVRGAFTKVLVQALRQYRNGNRLTLAELQGFVRQGVAELVAPEFQEPVFDLKSGGDLTRFIIAAGPPAGEMPSLRVTFPTGTGGQAQLIDKSDRPYGPPIAVVDDEISLPLPPGFYSIDHLGGQLSRSFIHVGPESTHVAL